MNTGVQGHVPPAERQATSALRQRVRRAAQRPRHGHIGPDGVMARGFVGRRLLYAELVADVAGANLPGCNDVF